MMGEEKCWAGLVPLNCDLCHGVIGSTFVDGRTTQGPWGCLCPQCHSRYGVGLGTGRGQRYDKQADGRWLKTAG